MDSARKNEKRKSFAVSGLKRLNNNNINPICKKKFNKLNNHSRENVLECHELSNENNIEVKETNNLENGMKPWMIQNFKPCMSKVTRGFKRMLYKFKMQINRKLLKHMRKEILNQTDADDVVYIIGRIINKMKEELYDQERILAISYSQQLLKYNFKSCCYKSASTNENNLRLQTELSLHEESLDSISELENDMNSYNTPVKIKHKKNERNLSVGNRSTTTAVVEINKVDSGNKPNWDAILSKLKDISVIKTSIKKPRNIYNSLDDNNLEITERNWKHPTEIGTTIETNFTETDQYPIEIDKCLLENRPRSMEIQYLESDPDSDEFCSCPTVNLSPKNVEDMCIVRIHSKSIRRHGRMDRKIFMDCKVELDRLNI
ncbi:uncharacterized protein LOC144477747 [Augochlora pura]